MSNMAYNLCLCHFQASMLNTTVETVCTYKHLNMPTIIYKAGVNSTFKHVLSKIYIVVKAHLKVA